MKQRKIKVAILFGGRSAEHEVSLVSANAIFRNLDQTKYEVLSIFINKKGEWKAVPSPLLPPEALNEGASFPFLPWKKSAAPPTPIKADIYFPALHGPFGEDGTIQALLELADVPYVGAGVLASAVGMDKVTMKAAFVVNNIPVARYLPLFEIEWVRNRAEILKRIASEFPLPFFVKPANLGSSVGISKVKDYGQTAQALEMALAYDRKILIEDGIAGRELECSVLGNDDPKASLPGEVLPYREFYDYHDKYIDGKTAFKIPAELPAAAIEEIRRLAVEAYKAVDCSGMARIDFFLEEKTGKFFVNELNTIPGFTEISMYPKLWEVSGLPFPRLLDELIRLGFERHRNRKICVDRTPP